MASIGSGPGISSGPKIQVSAVRPVGTSSGNAEQTVGASTTTASQSAPVVSTTALNAGEAPVDTDRVASIRKAIEDGNYPIIPTKISDAMIAAGMMLRV
jgi:negative regulator of flagellin synthesis FlgM